MIFFENEKEETVEKDVTLGEQIEQAKDQEGEITIGNIFDDDILAVLGFASDDLFDYSEDVESIEEASVDIQDEDDSEEGFERGEDSE